MDKQIICIATPLYPPDIGGPATYVRELEEGLSESFELRVVKFSAVRAWPKLIRHVLFFLLMVRHARGSSLVFALDPVSVGLPAMIAARVLRKPFVIKIVGDYAWEQGRQRFGIERTLDDFVTMPTAELPKPVQRFRRIQTRVGRSADTVIVPSEYLKRIVASWGIAPERIHVVYNAVSLSEVGQVPPAVLSLLRPRVVSVGRMVPWKEFDGVIDAVKQTKASLAIVGEGALYEHIAARAKQELGTMAHLTGALSHADTLAVIQSADIFVLNSSYEGFSHVLIEALLLGKAVIATDAGGNGEIVDGTNGLLIPPHATNVLARELNRVIGDPDLRISLEHNAKKIGAWFSKERMLTETAAVFVHYQ